MSSETTVSLLDTTTLVNVPCNYPLSPHAVGQYRGTQKPSKSLTTSNFNRLATSHSLQSAVLQRRAFYYYRHSAEEVGREEKLLLYQLLFLRISLPVCQSPKDVQKNVMKTLRDRGERETKHEIRAIKIITIIKCPQQ